MKRGTLAIALVLLAVVGAGGLAAVGLMLRAPADSAVEYTVVRGDTLFEIARDHGVSVDDLRVWNGIEGDLIEVGQVLRIHTAPPSTAAPPRARRPIAGVPLPRTAITAERPPLALPPEQPCLDGPSLDGTADEQMAASAGLSHDQVSSAMREFLPNVLPCIADADAAPTGTLLLEFTVACTGRVARVEPIATGDWGPELAACVTDVLGYTPFPAHDLPDGDRFQFPLRFTPP